MQPYFMFPSWIWDKSVPIAVPDASVLSKNGKQKSGLVYKISLKVSKAVFCAFPHLNALTFFVSGQQLS